MKIYQKPPIDLIEPTMLSDLTETAIVFVQSNNREIVKSALGLVKVATTSIDISIIRPHLGALVPALLGWSHDRKNHFKSKVKHIFERMIRRFGWDDVWNAAADDENAKVLTNLRKRSDRNQKKKRAANEGQANEESDEEVRKPQRSVLQ